MVSFSDSYADEDKSGIRVAQYLTELPSKEVLLRQLQKSLAVAKNIVKSNPSDGETISQGCKLKNRNISFTPKKKKPDKK